MDYDKQKLIHKQLLLSSTLTFTKKMYEYVNKKPYNVGEHHIRICKALDDVIKGKTRKLIINIAPRFGKTVLCSQMFIAYGLALNPNSKFLHLSYSGGLTQENSLAVKDILECEYFQNVFDTRIEFGNNTKSKWGTVQGGGEYATSTLGQITGFGAGQVDFEDEEKVLDEFTAKFNPDMFSGAIVIDDPLKPDDALSDNIRESVNRRFETTIRNRVNSRKTPIVVIMQRLHEHDLCGYLQEVEPDEWTVLSLPAIQRNEFGEERSLWPAKYTLSELNQLQKVSSYVFETQYMQNPTPMEGLMYREFKTYDIIPTNRNSIKCNYTDTADTGGDYLCSICYEEHTDALYVTDVLYTKKPVEFTEQAMAQMLCKQRTQSCIVESNNGGRIFMRNVERITREYGNNKTFFRPYTQRQNKQAKIYNYSNEVNNLIVFPSGWERKWPEFARDVKSFRKEGRNLNDDAPDVLSEMIIHKGESNNLSDNQLFQDFL